MDATPWTGSTPPRDTSVDIEAVRYDSSDGEDSHFYAVEWCLRIPTAWVEAPASDDLLSKLAATSGLLAEGVSIGSIRRMRSGQSVAVAWEYGPTVRSLVQVLTYEPGEPSVHVLRHPETFTEYPAWVRSALKRAVESHLAERAEVAA